MKHDWYLDENGPSKWNPEGIDIFRLSEYHHNGPECRLCGRKVCHHCHPEVYAEECPGVKR